MGRVALALFLGVITDRFGVGKSRFQMPVQDNNNNKKTHFEQLIADQYCRILDHIEGENGEGSSHLMAMNFS